MARNYYLEQNKQKFILAYGKHVVKSLVADDETTAVGSDLQVKFRRPLGVGEWDACEKLFYNVNGSARELSPSDYHFHPGGAVDAPDAFFPNAAPIPGIAYDSIRLPPGLAAEEKPENAIGIYRCLKIPDYLANGSQSDFGYSPNFARVIADLIKKCRPERFSQIIDWGSWRDLRDFCFANINATVDGQTVQIPRFAAHIYVTPPFNLDDAIDKLLQYCCSEVQWVNNKMRFIAPLNHDSVFSFDESNIGEKIEDFKYIPVDSDNRLNGIRILYRDLRHPYLEDAKPVVVDRRTDPAEPENFLELNIGVAEKSQAERLAAYLAIIKIDNAEFVTLNSLFSSYPVLPADIVDVTEETAGYINKKFQVIEKEEDDENGEEYPFKLQISPANAYSDAPQTNALTPTITNGPNPFAAPPPGTLELTATSTTLANGTVNISVVGNFTFGNFGFRQFGKVYHAEPGDGYRQIGNLRPDNANQDRFVVTNLKQGLHYFKVITYSELGVTQSLPGEEDSILISGSTFTINNTTIEPGVIRSLFGLGPQGRYRGEDTAVVPQSVMTAQIAVSTVVDEGANVEVLISGEVVGAKELQSAQGDSLYKAQVEVFDKFGLSQAFFVPEGFTGAGTLGRKKIPRKNLDPFEEAIFKWTVLNGWGSSPAKYLWKGVLYNAKPAAVDPTDYPRDLSASPISSSSIRFSALYTKFASYTLKLQKRNIGGTSADWIDHVSGINAFPYDAVGLEANRNMEYRFVASSNAAHFSNFVQGKTFQTGESVQTYPAPIGFDGNPNVSNATTQIDFSFIAKGNAPTKVKLNGVANQILPATAIDSTVSFSISGLTANQSITVEIVHDYGSGNLSSPVSITRSTNNPPGNGSSGGNGILNPEITSGSYSKFQERVQINFNEYGTGNVSVKRNISNTGWQEISLGNVVSPFYDFDVVAQDFETYFIDYQVFQTDAADGSNIWTVPVPIKDRYSCFLAGTLITMADGSYKPIERIQIGDMVLSFTAEGLISGKVIRTMLHENVHKFAELRLKNRDIVTQLTMEHRYLKPNGEFEAMRNLIGGDKIISNIDFNWRVSEIESITEILQRVDVYNFHVDTLTYFANDDAVHNAKY